MVKTLVSICLVLTVLSTAGASAEDITFAIGNFSPHHYEENGEIKGIYIEIVRKISKRLGLSPRFIQYPWKRALAVVKNGESDGIISVYKTAERLDFLCFPTESLGCTKIAIFTGKQTNMNIQAFSGLRGASLLQIRGSSYGPEFDTHKDIFNSIWLCDSIEHQIKLLEKRPSHLAIANETAFTFTSRRLGLQGKFKLVYVIKKDLLYVAFSNALGERCRRYAEKFSTILVQLKKEGQLSGISEKYFQ